MSGIHEDVVMTTEDNPDDQGTDLSSGKELRAEKNDRVSKELEEERDLLAVLQTVEGRRTIWRLVAAASPFAEPFVPGQPDSTNYNLGRSSWGRRVYNILHTSAPLRRLWLEVQEEAEANGW